MSSQLSVQGSRSGFGSAAKARARAVKRKLREISTALDLGFSTRSPFMSGVYYLFKSSFAREHHAVAAGRARFARDHAESQRSSYRLRRNVHRLEKGLIMPDRRSVFALDYISPTVDDYGRVVQSYAEGDCADAELIWAHDVLSEYFACVDLTNNKIKACHHRFTGHAAAYQRLIREDDAPAVPYVRDTTPLAVDIEAMAALAKRRRSVRSYDPRPVPRELVDRAVAVAGQAPSACNRQPFHFRIYDDPALVSKLIKLPAGTKSFANGVPCLAVVVGRLRAYPLERDRHIIYIDGSLAAMSFMFALESMGIASCAINWADEEPAESRVKAAMRLEDDERVIMMIALGWPDPQARVPYSAKRPVEELRKYNS